MTFDVDDAAWTTSPSVEQWASKRKFGSAMPVDKKSLQDFAKQYDGRPVGLYLWESSDHRIYIGISEKSVVTRLRSHIRYHSDVDIKTFRYQPMNSTRTELREAERSLIHEAFKGRVRSLQQRTQLDHLWRFETRRTSASRQAVDVARRPRGPLRS